MHPASLEKVRHFRDVYLDASVVKPIRVLDVGSSTVSGGEDDGVSTDRPRNYRVFFPAPDFDYTGLDVVAGANVDLVPVDPFRWTELSDESFDVVVCGQTFEHNPFFWVTLAEIARVLIQRGFVCIVAPSRGFVHRFPLDCWRFFPDAGPAMCSYVGLEMLESYVETRRLRKVTFGQLWHDFLLIGQKPIFESETERSSFYARLARITETRCPIPTQTGGVVGPAITQYELAQEASLSRAGRAYVEVALLTLRALYERILGATSSDELKRP